MQDVELQWFAMKVFWNKVFEVAEFLKSKEKELYFPKERTFKMVAGKPTEVVKPAISSLIFFKDMPNNALKMERELQNKVMLYTHHNGTVRVPSAIPEKEMTIFMLVTSKGENGLDYLEDNAKYRKGDRVLVTDGPFKDAEGYICRIKHDRRLVVSIQGICAVATSYIPSCFLKKIE